jgi:hypothetical protein
MNDGLAILFLIGLLVEGLLFFHFLVVQPVWAFVDCATSADRTKNSKMVWLLMMGILAVIGWSLVVAFWLGAAVTVVYGLFATRSTALKKATGIPLAVTMALSVGLLGLMVAVPAAKDRIPAPIRERIMAGEVDPVTHETIETVDPEDLVDGEDAVDPEGAVGTAPEIDRGDTFKALLITSSGSVALADFTLHGAVEGSAIPVSKKVQQVAAAPDGKTIYAVTKHEVGTLDPATGAFTEVHPDTSLPRVSWPIGCAYDAAEGVLLFDSRGPLYAFDDDRKEWKAIEQDGLEFCAMTHSPDRDTFYGLVSNVANDYVSRVVRINANGAVVGEIALSRNIPTHSWMDRKTQLSWSGGKLIVLVAPDAAAGTGMRMYVVDPDSGDVRKIL